MLLLSMWEVASVLLLVSCAQSLKVYNDFEVRDIDLPEQDYSAASDTLFLTPLIESGEIEKAQSLSAVTDLPTQLTSHTGYITVNKEDGGHMFFWYFPSQRDVANDPIIMWLQGGPGSSSMLGLFSIHGPLYVDPELNIHERELTWNKNYSTVYVDNPVGTGFSFVENDNGFVTNQTQVGRDLFEFLQQFFTLFPNHQKNDFYIVGESYGGMYVPAISHYILTHSTDVTRNFNFKGMGIGNGWTHPLGQCDNAEFFEQVGLIDATQRAEMGAQIKICQKYIEEENWEEADENCWSNFYEYTGLQTNLNYLWTNDPDDLWRYSQYLDKVDVHDAIHVGDVKFGNQSGKVNRAFTDGMMSRVPWVEDILNSGLKSLFYSGHVDACVPYPSTLKFINEMKWKDSESFLAADRQIWMTGDWLSGYVRQYGALTQVMVHSSGHMVPHDQPEAGLDMINRFITDTPFA